MAIPEKNPGSAPAATHRLFLALWPSDEVRERLRATVDAVDAFEGRGRRVAPAKYHITLHFLGGEPGSAEQEIARIREVVAPVSCMAFHLVVDHAGSFRGSRVGWLAPSGNSGLDALWAELGRRLDEAGIARRAHETFNPHVTVLRDLRGRVAETPVDPLSWPVEDFVLVHSHDGRYDIVDRWPLQAG